MESSLFAELGRDSSRASKHCIGIREDYHPWQDDLALVALLKACATQKDLCRGLYLHAQIFKRALLQLNVFVGNALVHMYSNCGSLAKAYQVFNQLPIHTVVSWNTLLAAYVRHGYNEEALKCPLYMRTEGLIPDRFTFACILTACGSIRATERGRDIHTEIVAFALSEGDIVLGNALVNMYAKCGALDEARKVFEQLPSHNEISWTALITGSSHHGYGQDTLDCFTLMKHEGFVPDAVTFACILKACGGIGSSKNGEATHAAILREGLLGRNSTLGVALVDMYAKCDKLPKAHFLLMELSVRDTISWNALIGGYCQHGHGQDALRCFKEMDNEHVSPDVVTYTCILKACASAGTAEKGQEVHSEIVRRDLLWNDPVLGNTLVDMYAKCGALANAQEVFDKLSVRDVTTWTALLGGYYEMGSSEYALKCFEMMKQEGICPDEVSLSCILKACGSIGAADKGRQLHSEIIKRGLLGNLNVLESALVDMYVNCGALSRAQLVFDEIPCPDSVSWNILISGYYEHGCAKGSIRCFEIMECPPDAVTYATVLKACGSIGAAQKGAEIHSEIARTDSLSKYVMLGSTLVDMYAKCGALLKAQEVFDRLPIQDVVSFTALITAYSKQGDSKMVFMCFEQMIHAGLFPDAVTFACILKACSSIGETVMGLSLFESMCTCYGIIPSVEHHTCMVDLLSRYGHYERAMTLMEKMPPPHHFSSWFTLLSACQKSGNTNLARLAFEHV